MLLANILGLLVRGRVCRLQLLLGLAYAVVLWSESPWCFRLESPPSWSGQSQNHAPTDSRAPYGAHDKMFVAVLLLCGALYDKGLPIAIHSPQEQDGCHYIHRTVLTFTRYSASNRSEYQKH
jgi:hypothetical protein